MDNISILIKILSIKGIGPAMAQKLIPPPYISCDSDLLNFLQEKTVKLSRLKLGLSFIRSGIERGNRIIAESRNHNISFLEFNSPTYPTLLKTIKNPPLILSYMGDIDLLNKKCVAVIGTREPTMAGKVTAYNCGKSLANIGVVTVSGLAKGIDSSAHIGCLDSGGKTIAVVGNGLETVYPSESKLLARKILDGCGLIITECFYGEKASPGSLLLRNRMVVGLCNSIIVAETGLRGGTMYTVDLGLKVGRKVGCLTYESDDRIGNLNLLKNDKVRRLIRPEGVLHFLND